MATKRSRYLTREELDAAYASWHLKESRDLVITSHRPLARSIARKHARCGLPIEDLMSAAIEGLVIAASKFDPVRGSNFGTYAAFWVRASVQDHIQRNWSMVRNGTSSPYKQLFFMLHALKAKADATGMSRRSAIVSAAEQTGIPFHEVETLAARLWSGGDVSLDAPISGTGDLTRGDGIADPAPLPDQQCEDAMDGAKRVAALRSAIGRLNAREREIIVRRQMVEDRAETMESIGAQFGISKERVRQIEAGALAKLRKILTADYGALFVTA